VPTTLNMIAGDSLQVRAVAILLDQTQQIVTTSASWQSSNLAVATVDAAGIVTALSIGTTDITATLDTLEATASLTVSSDQGAVTRYVGAVAAPGGEAGSLVIVIGETARVTGTFYFGDQMIEVLGRRDAPTGIVNVVGGGFTFLGTLKGNALSGRYESTDASGGFSAIDATHRAATSFCGTYTSNGTTSLGNEDAGTFVLTASVDGTVVATSAASDASATPRQFVGRREGSSFELTTTLGASAAGVLENSTVTGSIRNSATTGTFAATPATCP
jgi:hypothetical protein